MSFKPRLAYALLLVPLLAGCGLAGNMLSPFGIGDDEGGPPGATMSSSEYSKAMEVFVATNEYRVQMGLEPLTWSEDAAQVAFMHCADMRTQGYIAHENLNGDNVRGRMRAAGVEFFIAGENIHYRSPPRSAASAMAAWQASSGHRDTMLYGGWTHIGVGMHNSGDACWWVQVFYTP